MANLLKRLHREEEGITALETAIILIAFVVVAAVFAFTILSAGTFSTEKGKEAVFAGLEEVRSTLEIRGSVLAIADAEGVTETVDSLVFNLAIVAGGEPVDFTPPTNNKVVIDYRDASQRVTDLSWTVTKLGDSDTDDMLEDGELFAVTVPVTITSVLADPGLPADTTFALEVKPPRGGVLIIERTTPAYIDKVIDLH